MTVQRPEWSPELGTRPPFAPGNELAVQHGAYSPRKVEPLARELVEGVLADQNCAHVHAAAYRPALWAWARAEAQAQLLDEYIAKRGEESEDGVGDLDEDRVRSAYLLQHRAEARANTGRTRLGLDPLSRARLGRDVAAGVADTARVMAELEARDKREREAAAAGSVAPGELAP